MSALTDRIAEVMDDHRHEFNPNGHINGTVPGQGTHDCFCDEVFAKFAGWAAHVAERIEAELQLTEERRMTDRGFGTKPTYRRRWVSAWSGMES